MIGIYKIENLENRKCYVGSSTNIKYRFATHLHHLINNKHDNNYLQNSWNKYGKDNFKFGIIEECEEGELVKKEQGWINYFKNIKNSYNLRLYCDSNRGMSLSDEHKTKISNALKGRKRTIEEKEHLRKINLGKKLSKETKNKISKSNMGHHVSEETKIKIGNANSGRKLSKEHKIKLSQAKIGKPSWNKGLPKEMQPRYNGVNSR